MNNNINSNDINKIMLYTRIINNIEEQINNAMNKSLANINSIIENNWTTKDGQAFLINVNNIKEDINNINNSLDKFNNYLNANMKVASTK